MRRLWWIGVALFMLPLATAAADVTVRVEPEHVSVDKPFLIIVEASGGQVGEPVIPDVEGLPIEKAPAQRNDRFQVNIVGMDMRRSVVKERGYYARTLRAGTYTIGRIGVEIYGRMQYSEPFVLTVHEASAGPAGRKEKSRGRARDGQTRGLTWGDLVFITSDVDKRDVYEGEPVHLRLELWQIILDGLRIGTHPGVSREEPSTEGFYVLPLEERKKRETRNGYRYDVTEYGLMAYPTRTGELTIGPWHWEGQARNWRGSWSWFGPETHNYDLSTPPIHIKVKQLPERPARFSGAVGDFNVEAELARDKVLQGVPTQLTLRVMGRGNPDAIGEPPLPALEGVYIDEPERETGSVKTPEGVIVEKRFIYSVTPLKAGDLQIPEIAFCYFDPTSEVYVTKTVGPFLVRALATPEEQRRLVLTAAPMAQEQKAVEVLNVDILGMITEPGKLKPQRTMPFATPMAVVAPAVAYSGFALAMRRRRRFERDVSLARSYYAKSKGRKRLGKVASAREPAEELYRAVVGFVADTFNEPEAGMTSADVQRLFRAHAIDSELAGKLLKTLRACERARYGSARLSDEELRALIQGAAVNMDRLDNVYRKGNRA